MPGGTTLVASQLAQLLPAPPPPCAEQPLLLDLPVLAHAVGGIASTLPDGGCGRLFAPHPSAAEVAAWMAARLNFYWSYPAWRADLEPRLREFTWEAAVEQLGAILG